MKQGDTVLLQISRTSQAGADGDEVQMEIADTKTGEHIRLAMSLLDYARILTGEAHIPVEVRRCKGAFSNKGTTSWDDDPVIGPLIHGAYNDKPDEGEPT